MKHTILATLFLLTCALVFAQEEKTISKSFKDVTSIRLTVASGDITVKKASGKDVNVVVKYNYDDDEYTAMLNQNAGQLVMEEKFSRGNHSGNSSWTLEIPDNLKAKMSTGSGNLTISQIAVDLDANTGSGDIEVTTVKGELDFNTGSGNVELSDVNGEVELNTGSGDIRAERGSGSYAFNAGSGRIRLNQLKGDFTVNTGSGDVDGKALTFTGASSFNTGSGDNVIALAAPLDHSISINSGSGNSTLNFNGNPIAGEIIMTANKGEDIVAPFKFDKEEDVTDGGSRRVRKTARIGTKNITIKIGTGSGKAEIVK